MDDELKSLREFRAGRLAEIAAGRTPVMLREGLRTAVHVIPFNALQTGLPYDELSLSIYHQTRDLRPIYSSGMSTSRYNFDGFLIHGQMDRSGAVGAYLQVFWTGALESVNTLASGDPSMSRAFPALECEERLLSKLPSYIDALRGLKARPPLFLALSLLGTFGYVMDVPPPVALSTVPEYGGRIEGDTLILPDAIAENFDCNFGEVLKPAFDAIWKAAGWEGSIFYEGSTWVGLAKYFPR